MSPELHKHNFTYLKALPENVTKSLKNKAFSSPGINFRANSNFKQKKHTFFVEKYVFHN